MGAAYEYRHVVGFEETSLVGNVYYINYLRWQGRCRELFLRDYAPEVLDQMERGLALVTTRCSCEYLQELSAFDEVVVRMRSGGLRQNRIGLLFDYWRKKNGREELIAHGEQEVACMVREGAGVRPAAIPDSLRTAILRFQPDAAAAR